MDHPSVQSHPNKYMSFLSFFILATHIQSSLCQNPYTTCSKQYQCMDVSVDIFDRTTVKICMTFTCASNIGYCCNNNGDQKDNCNTICGINSCNNQDNTIKIGWKDGSGCSSDDAENIWLFHSETMDPIDATCESATRTNGKSICDNANDKECIWIFSIDSYCDTINSTFEPISTENRAMESTVIDTFNSTETPTIKPTNVTLTNSTKYPTSISTTSTEHFPIHEQMTKDNMFESPMIFGIITVIFFMLGSTIAISVVCVAQRKGIHKIYNLVDLEGH